MSESLRFGRFEVRAASRQLLADGQPVALGARAFDLLVALIERRQRVVPKSELLDLVWPGLVVEENNLQVQVSGLRKILGAHAIATVAGRGYRFTLDPGPGAVPASGADRQAAPGLPQSLSSFVGREAELEALARHLETSRLVSLTGIGGTGKTRLAIELGRRIASRYAGAVSFCDLAPVDRADGVPGEVARACGIPEEPNRPLRETLAQHFATADGLLILDNCEHVVAACAGLVEHLLLRSEALRVVVTSREALGVAGERIYGVASLSLPAAGAAVADAQTAESVQLLLERARLAAPDFALDQRNVGAAVEICRRLDGIPLAIELAAARLRVLSLEQVRDRLDDRFRLLSAGNRTMGRHQTLRATLQWSYEHLAPDEQSLLQKASVFAGGWTLEAAAAANGGQSDGFDLVDRHARLLDKSLITVDLGAGASPRYSMLETVRDFARELLEASGGSIAIHDAHLEHFLALSREAHRSLPVDFLGTLERIDRELPNFLAAHAWCARPHVPAERGLELVAKLRRYWIERDRYALGEQLLREALLRPGAERPTAQRAEALFALGQHLNLAGRNAEALEPLAEALALARLHGDRGQVVWCLNKLAGAHLQLQALGQARDHVEESVQLARAIGTAPELSAALSALGDVRRFEGRFADAADAYEEAMAIRSDDDLGNAHALMRNLAHVAIGSGRLDYAASLLRDCMQLGQRYDRGRSNHRDLAVAAHLAAARGQWARAARLRGAVDAAADALGIARDLWGDAVARRLLDEPRKTLGQPAYESAWSAGYALTLGAALEEAIAWIDEAPRASPRSDPEN